MDTQKENKAKKEYEPIEIKVIRFNKDDFLRTSGEAPLPGEDETDIVY